jgi:predicted nucleotide-binding protein (sugar kinase/HSP70/actin superfamily)
MTQNTFAGTEGKKKLRLIDSMDVDAELLAFEEAERARLGLNGQKPEQWVDKMLNLTFTKKEKSNITMLVGGLTLAHDQFVEAALSGVGYTVQMLEVPSNEAFQTGKEYGNRGQCNPTYFTVGNLVKALIDIRDAKGLTSQEVVNNYVFLTAGACGPCRFGMYVTEYRKALRDAGFDGFRVLLFQQKGGVKQATGEESGLELNPTFFWAVAKSIFAGDVMNALGYRLRPYEKVEGSTDKAMDLGKAIVCKALREKTNICYALWQAKPLFETIEVDRTLVKPKVSIIGEFWAMTTEGDGNYGLQRFLEAEGAEDDIQLVAAWLLYTVWEGRFDTAQREDLRGADTSYYGLGTMGAFGLGQRKVALWAADKGIRVFFHTFANLLGLYGYVLPNMDKIAEVSHAYYNNDLRGGEGHMEVGKLILNTIGKKAHMTLSVKPFGCMPSAGVSDGVQSAITERFPGTIYCPVETSGDGRVNFYSRVQMYLFKAKQAALTEYEQALKAEGVTQLQVDAFLEANPKYASALHVPPHKYSGTAADLVAEVAPYIKLTRKQRWEARAAAFLAGSRDAALDAPKFARKLAKEASERAPEIARRVKEDISIFREVRASKKNKSQTEATTAAAAE